MKVELKKSAAILSCNHVIMGQDLKGICPTADKSMLF